MEPIVIASAARTPVGAFGHAGVFGFYPNKQITTGEGGMIVTNDERLADCCRSLRNQGRAPRSGGATVGSWLAHERLGFNYRLSEIHAALGVAQLERLDELVELRQSVAQLYVDRLNAALGVAQMIRLPALLEMRGLLA